MIPIGLSPPPPPHTLKVCGEVNGEVEVTSRNRGSGEVIGEVIGEVSYE